MADRLAEEVVTEAAENAFRRIARNKRGVADDQIDGKMLELLKKGAQLRTNPEQTLLTP